MSLITRTLVEGSARLQFLPKHFGKHHLEAARNLHFYLEKFCNDSSKAKDWRFYELSNGGFYLAPGVDEVLLLDIPRNHLKKYLSADVVGIICTLYTLDALRARQEINERHYSLKLIEQFQRLVCYANQYKEHEIIANAIA